MSALQSDPRVNDLLLANPTEIATLADYFRSAAQESRSTATGLRAAQQDGVWHGDAADAFRRAIGRLPVKLDSLLAGFRDAAAALTSYEAALTCIQAAFAQLTGELGNWSAQLGPAQTAADTARAALRRLLHTPGTRGPAILAAQRDVERAEGTLGDVNDVVGRLRRQAHALLDEFEQQRAACRSRIAAARGLAPPAPVEIRIGPPVELRIGPQWSHR